MEEKIKLPRISEHAEQANFITTVLMQYSHRDDFVKEVLFAVPNGSWFGGSNPWAMFNKFAAEGFRKGVSDLIYLQARGPWSCLAIEMKALDRKGKKDAVSEDQQIFIDAVKGVDGLAIACFGCDEAVNIFDQYMRRPFIHRAKLIQLI
jgi:hypothetical protein